MAAIEPPQTYPITMSLGTLRGDVEIQNQREWADEMVRMYAPMQGIDHRTGKHFSAASYFIDRYVIPYEEAKRLEKGREVGADFQESFESLIDWVNTEYIPNRAQAAQSSARPNIQIPLYDPKTTPRSVKASEEFQDPIAETPYTPSLKTKKFTPAGLGGGLPSTTLLGGKGSSGTTFLG